MFPFGSRWERRSTRGAVIGLIALAVGLSGCGDDGDADATSRTTIPSSSSTTTTAPTTTTTTALPPITLEPDGLGVVAFGASEAETVRVIQARLGAPTGTGPGCEVKGGNVKAVRWHELSVEFSDGEFDAWGLNPGDGQPALAIKTKAGVGLGTTVAGLKAAYPGKIEIPYLDREVFGGNTFHINFGGGDDAKGILGGLSDETDRGVIRSFFTETCE